MSFYFDRFYGPSTPIKAKGGIKAQTQRGEFGKSWWAKRWIAILESFDLGGRLSRGRSYARKGQVTALEVGKGSVNAKVQGSMPKPYKVKIELDPLSEKEWKKVLEKLSGQALFTAKLLAGEMPQEIEEVFIQAGVSLFPKKNADLKTDCSCPDYSNPCKHIAAVYYLLGEEFDRDPFLLFQLRGVSREELLSKLDRAPKSAATEEVATPIIENEPLSAEVNSFWNIGELPDDLFGEVLSPPVAAALPKRLGNFPFWRGEQQFLAAMGQIYQQASQRGLSLFLGEENEKPKK